MEMEIKITLPYDIKAVQRGEEKAKKIKIDCVKGKYRLKSLLPDARTKFVLEKVQEVINQAASSEIKNDGEWEKLQK